MFFYEYRVLFLLIIVASVLGCNISVIPLKNQIYIGLPGFNPEAEIQTIDSSELLEEETRESNVEHAFVGCEDGAADQY